MASWTRPTPSAWAVMTGANRYATTASRTAGAGGPEISRVVHAVSGEALRWFWSTWDIEGQEQRGQVDYFVDSEAAATEGLARARYEADQNLSARGRWPLPDAGWDERPGPAAAVVALAAGHVVQVTTRAGGVHVMVAFGGKTLLEGVMDPVAAAQLRDGVDAALVALGAK